MRKSKISNRTAKSSSSNQGAKSSHSENVLELGKRLVEELDLDDSVDTLGRWMAHHIAEKIKSAETAEGPNRSIKMQEASDEILKLWSHRRVQDPGKRPLKSFEPVFRAISSFDPENSRLRYFQRVDDDCESENTRRWLNSAIECDEAARYVITSCLSEAAKTAIDNEQDWVRLANAVTPSDEDVRAMAILLGDRNYGLNRKKDLVRKLKQLSKLCESAIGFLSATSRSQKEQKKPSSKGKRSK